MLFTPSLSMRHFDPREHLRFLPPASFAEVGMTRVMHPDEHGLTGGWFFIYVQHYSFARRIYSIDRA